MLHLLMKLEEICEPQLRSRNNEANLVIPCLLFSWLLDPPIRIASHHLSHIVSSSAQCPYIELFFPVLVGPIDCHHV